ncbi:unnamed protein product [Mytilus coruscus]|uniref:Endonuclease/exonuclease/phosphatase domain-containing protein n=1 Tax=Mytilus coruscus TaxID=42192 RepID=A0A6J8C3R2_MYTCO|nr:unnamed protein product [Mytilus coruscus]
MNSTTKQEIDILTHEGKVLLNKNDIANCLNDHFSTVGEKLISNPHKRFKSEKINNYVKSKINDDAKFSLYTVTNDEVLQALKNLDITKSTGTDGVGPIILKLSRSIVASPLAHIINLSLWLNLCPPLVLTEMCCCSAALSIPNGTMNLADALDFRANNDMSAMKTTLPEQTKEILKGMFAQGMVSKGKKCSVLHNQAVERTGLPLQVIKEQFTDIADWAPAWNLLGQEEKEQYKKKAQEKPVAPPKPQQKDAFKRLKIIREHVIELEKLGMDVALIGINTNNGAQILLGDGKSAAFLKLEDILQNLFAFHSLGQTFNNFYIQQKQLEKKHSFPYKKVRTGELLVNGIPLDVLPLTPMSDYGEQKIKMILEIKEISVEVQQNSRQYANQAAIFQKPILSCQQPNNTNQPFQPRQHILSDQKLVQNHKRQNCKKPIVRQDIAGQSPIPEKCQNVDNLATCNTTVLKNRDTEPNKDNVPTENSADVTNLNCGTLNVQNALSNQLYLVNVLKKCDILFIQEHWLYSCDKHKLQGVNDTHICKAKSVDDDLDTEILVRNRGFGGTADFWRKDIDRVVRCTSDGNDRRVVLTFNISNNPLCLIGVYMPSHNKHGDELYIDILSQIEEIIEKYHHNGYQVMWRHECFPL